MGKALAAIFRVLALCAWSAALAFGAESGPAAWYSFDEGPSAVLKDHSGNGENGKIAGAKYVSLGVGKGYALELDGVDSYAARPGQPAFDITGPLTIATWVNPADKQTAGEAGIIGKDYSSYLLTCTGSSKLWFYIGSGDNHVNAAMEPGVWSHVAGVFDGQDLRLYVNGQLVARKASRRGFDSAQPADFLIGCVNGNPGAADPNTRVSGFFSGLVDDVIVYNRALSDDEISSRFGPKEVAVKNSAASVECKPVKAVESLKSGNLSVTVGKDGRAQIGRGKSSCVVESAFSYPEKIIGWNSLSGDRSDSEPSWKPIVSRKDKATITIKASGELYALVRSVRISGERVEFEDTLTSKSDSPTGVLVASRFIVPDSLSSIRKGHSAANPTVFFSQKTGDFGVVAEDDVSRAFFEASAVANAADIKCSNFALNAGKSYTFRFAVYPLKPTGDVFNFINTLRRDWNANFTVLGPMSFYSEVVGSLTPVRQDKDALQAIFQRKNVGVMSGLWVDYDSAPFGHIITMDEYKSTMQDAVMKLHEANPNLIVLGCIETDWATIYPEKMKDGQVIIDHIQKEGFTLGTPAEVTRVIDQADLPWKDSIKRDKDGNVFIEKYTRGDKPVFAVGVYPAPGNYQHKYMINQAEFVLDEVGLDGLYTDDFSQTWNPNAMHLRSYDKWDGFSAEIDQSTGEITRKFTQCGLAGIKSRLEIIKMVLQRGKTHMANSWPTTILEQSLPSQRFDETWSTVNLDALNPGPLSPGKKPPFMENLWDGVLGSPIGLGAKASADRPNLSECLMLALMTYLRHGMLYYHYQYPNIPTDGEYGPINHMFPFTPAELHEGWLKGKERIISAVSLETDWLKPTKPKVVFFDMSGRDSTDAGRATITNKNGKWHIKLTMKDWGGIAVVE